MFTARGEVFTLPVQTGGIVKVAANSAVRYPRGAVSAGWEEHSGAFDGERGDGVLEVSGERE